MLAGGRECEKRLERFIVALEAFLRRMLCQRREMREPGETITSRPSSGSSVGSIVGMSKRPDAWRGVVLVVGGDAEVRRKSGPRFRDLGLVDQQTCESTSPLIRSTSVFANVYALHYFMHFLYSSYLLVSDRSINQFPLFQCSLR